jgi:hypothetical protein
VIKNKTFDFLFKIGVSTLVSIAISFILTGLYYIVDMGLMDSSRVDGLRATTFVIYPWYKIAVNILGEYRMGFISSICYVCIQFIVYGWVFVTMRFLKIKLSISWGLILVIHILGLMLLSLFWP